nr:MAG TPA: hypothetical protein [Caudoviricetes sp.]
MKRKTAIKFMMSACYKKMDRNTVTRLFDQGRKIAPNYSNDQILYTLLRACEMWAGLDGQPEQQGRAAFKTFELVLRQAKRGRDINGQHHITTCP